MKPQQMLLAWLITLITGFVLAIVISEDPSVALILSLLAAICSVPAIAILIFMTTVLNNFWSFQVIHFISAVVIYFADERFFSDLFWVVYPYFLIGLCVQAFWRFKALPKKEEI
jgi:ABC-type proline/glycine betaine transport system permease subunit